MGAIPSRRPVTRTPLLAALLALAAPLPAVGQDVGGVYGRLDGDLVLSVEALGAWHADGGGASGALSVAARARYLEMTGLALGYDRAFTSARRDALWLAVDFRPAWLARFTNDLERGPRWLDLLLDSIGVELGAAWVRPGEPIGRGGGFGFVLGGGAELPLVWSRGDGLMLRVGARWISARAWDAQGTGALDGSVELGVGLVLRTLVRTGLMGRPQ